MSSAETPSPTRRYRDLSGVLLLDKAAGQSSNHALQQVRRLLQAKKAGHTGTLDPFATGLMVLCFGEANKYARWMLGASKTYQFTIQLGQATNTGDPEGEVIAEQAIPAFSAVSLQSICQQFLGSISQIPPAYSALKINGQRAYDLARAGETVELAPRHVTIHQLQLQRQGEDCLVGEATVSKGTYIRTLAQDIALALGTVGYCAQLRRTAIAQFTIAEAQTASQIEALLPDHLEILPTLQPLDVLCQNFARLNIDGKTLQTLRFGQLAPIDVDIAVTEDNPVNAITKPEQALYRLYCHDQFIGLAEWRCADEQTYLKAFRLVCSE